jgi:hypothetical protein
MYDKETSVKVQKIASEGLVSTQAKIDQLNSMGTEQRNRASSNLFKWQEYVGNIAIGLSAIVGAGLFGDSTPSLQSFASFIILLTTGLWITLYHKITYEKQSIGPSRFTDEYRVLYDDQKKAAFELWEDPSNISKHINYLKHELRVTVQSIRDIKKQTKEIKQFGSKISYLNDIWLAMLVIGVYLLSWNSAYQLLSHKISNTAFLVLYISVLAIFLLTIIIVALRQREPIRKANEDTLKKLRSELRHSEAYAETIKDKIASLDDLFSEIMKQISVSERDM